MKEIIGDDYPTYEDSVKMTLAEKAKASNLTLENACTYLNEVEQKITKDNLERLMLENLQLKHRLACIKDDIEIIDRHIRHTCAEKFAQPSRSNEDNEKYTDNPVFACEAIHNVTNIEIACDLSDESVDEWGSDLAEEYRQNIDKTNHL